MDSGTILDTVPFLRFTVDVSVLRLQEHEIPSARVRDSSPCFLDIGARVEEVLAQHHMTREPFVSGYKRWILFSLLYEVMYSSQT